MPSQKKEFTFQGQTAEQLLLIAYRTFLELGWTVKYAGPAAIIGYTPRSWNKYDDEILIEAVDGSITITSSLVHNESFDLLGKNKKHINDFIAAFEKVKASGIKTEWTEELENLRAQTIESVTKQQKQAEEIRSVMNLSGSGLYATYGIIGINVIVFILMVINGAGLFSPNALVHIKWGSNYTPLTLSGDWWRLISCMFIHFGLIHIVMNIYALYTAGVYLEPILGKTKFILAYLCTGVMASLTSLWWHAEGVNSAGASGAVFGMYGVFLALLFTNLIPKQIRGGLLQSIAVFVVFNLIYGMRSGVDNAAHAGGLASGLIIGFVFYLLLKNKVNSLRNQLVLLAIASITVLAVWMYLNNPGNIVSKEKRQAEINYLKESDFADSDKYYEKYNEFAESDARIVALFNNDSPSYSEWVEINETKLNEEFNKASAILETMKKYNVSEGAKKKTDLLEQLLNARKEEVLIIKDLAKEDNGVNQLRRKEIQEKLEGILNELKKAN
jgi:rhomboid protease GluP